MRDAIYLKECTPAFPRIASRHEPYFRVIDTRDTRDILERGIRGREIDIRCVCNGIYVGYEYHDRETRTVRLALVTVCCVSRIHAIHCQILRGDSTQRPRIMVIDGAKLPNLP